MVNKCPLNLNSCISDITFAILNKKGKKRTNVIRMNDEAAFHVVFVLRRSRKGTLNGIRSDARARINHLSYYSIEPPFTLLLCLS